MGSSALNTTRQTGGVIGVALLGALASAHPVAGTEIAMVIAVLACAAAATSAWRNLPPEQQPAAVTARRRTPPRSQLAPRPDA